MREQIRDFYDEFSTRLLANYVHGNPRVEAAIIFALKWIPQDAKRILDIGCGIGWSTWEFKRHFPDACVVGVDISPKIIEIAKKIFDAPKLHFVTHDVLHGNLVGPPFDAVVMIDVYEHIPKNQRENLHKILKEVLNPSGVLILTFPSVFHQNFLRTYCPAELQPIDEDVTFDDIEELAKDLDGHVRYKSYVHIWRPNDYVHVVIDRDKEGSGRYNSFSKKYVILESTQSRRSCVMSRLKVRVTREGILLPNQGQYTVCIVSPNKNAYSETFIRAHIERLPAKVKVLYGGLIDADTDRHIMPRFLRGVCFVLRRGLSRYYLASRIERVISLSYFLKRNKVDAVLAEYGHTGVAVMDACLDAKVPLIVHFHGFDASHYPTLENFSAGYQQMFKVADAIIAVSRDMEQKLIELGAPKEKVIYNHYGVDTSLFRGADPASSAPLFVAVGRFVEKKAPHLTLLAFKKVVEVCQEARLVMIGDGKLWGACKQLAKALKIDNAVEFLGARPHTEVAFTMRQARAFVQHSIRAPDGDSEGTPVAVLEAGATGLPVVSTRHGGIKDVVIDCETGFLVDEGDVDGMAERMVLLAKDPDLAARLGKNASERISAEFSMEKSIGNLWRIIEGIIQERGY